MNAKIVVLTCLIMAGAGMGLRGQAPAPEVAPAPPADVTQAAPPDTAVTAAPAEAGVVAKDEPASDQPAPKPRKKGRVKAPAPTEEVHVRTHDENGDKLIRRFDGEGAPGLFEQRIERLDSESGPLHKEVRIYRDGNLEHEDVVVHDGGPGGHGLRAEIAPRPPMGGGAPLIQGELTPERVDHLEQAIRHLHAAGLDPLADRLQTRVDRFHAVRRGPEPDHALREEIDRLKEEHQKLQQELRRLQKAIQAKNKKDNGATE